MKRFFELADGQTGGVNEVSIGIIGFGHFASPIQMFLGTYELKKVLNRLYTLSERYISRYLAKLNSVPINVNKLIFRLPVRPIKLETLSSIFRVLFLHFQIFYLSLTQMILRINT